ncbi:hypothetical protein CXG81DRAFT_27374 [Caulochytrium protostelioides]|uniref:Uncharacterized protein n=1 Tax=Caulochytrium protostelioides TaxID=1555241 RepID=A0A4P9X4A0_9FUNG|nr:hypothetical protein CXG81DRAFT_27374 [Caulochytrium protostelioides]|eukprot:RKO99896.1 hypothetical protein CXG81DRAFT_27374 [Caulochytrium protostelioides]
MPTTAAVPSWASWAPPAPATVADDDASPQDRRSPAATRCGARRPVASGGSMRTWGWLLLAATAAQFLAISALLVLACVPPTQRPVTRVPALDAVLADPLYWALLGPAASLSLVYLGFLNWLGLKYFRHNQVAHAP